MTFFYEWEDKSHDYTPKDWELREALATVLVNIYFDDFDHHTKLKICKKLEKLLVDFDDIDGLAEMYEEDLMEYFEEFAREQAYDWHEEEKQFSTYYGY
jgi:hypothetical protein